MTISYNNADIVLTTSAASITSVGFNSSIIITRLTLTNTDNIAHTFKIYRVPNGGTVSVSNQIAGDVNQPIIAGQTISVPLTGHSLVAGQSLQGLADANAVLNLSISYTQIDP